MPGWAAVLIALCLLGLTGLLLESVIERWRWNRGICWKHRKRWINSDVLRVFTRVYHCNLPEKSARRRCRLEQSWGHDL